MAPCAESPQRTARGPGFWHTGTVRTVKAAQKYPRSIETGARRPSEKPARPRRPHVARGPQFAIRFDRRSAPRRGQHVPGSNMTYQDAAGTFRVATSFMQGVRDLWATVWTISFLTLIAPNPQYLVRFLTQTVARWFVRRREWDFHHIAYGLLGDCQRSDYLRGIQELRDAHRGRGFVQIALSAFCDGCVAICVGFSSCSPRFAYRAGSYVFSRTTSPPRHALRTDWRFRGMSRSGFLTKGHLLADIRHIHSDGSSSKLSHLSPGHLRLQRRDWTDDCDAGRERSHSSFNGVVVGSSTTSSVSPGGRRYRQERERVRLIAQGA